MSKMEIRKGDYDILKREYETFIDYVDVSKKTISNYKNGLDSFFRYLKINNIVKPQRSDIKNYRDELLANYCAGTVNTYMTAVREFFKYLNTQKIYDDVAENIKGAKTSSTPKKQVLTKEAVADIYRNLTDTREKALFSLLITTGLRSVEVSNAKLEDIKYHNGEIVLWVKKKNHSEKDEYVKISDKVFEDIKKYVGERKNGYIFVGNSNRNRGNMLTTKTIRVIIKNILKRFGFDEDSFSCHSFRRSFATIAYKNGADIYSIQQVLSHKNITTTTIYLRAADRDDNNTEINVSNILLGGNSGK